MITRRLAARLGLLGAAIAGVVAGHELAYALAFPDGGLRHQALTLTGHGYWPSAVLAAIALGVAVLGGRIWRELRGDPSPVRLGPAALQLALAQTLLFLVLETVERGLTGASARAFVTEAVFPVGVAAQVLIACAIVLGVHLLARSVRAIARLVRRRLLAPRALPRPRLPRTHRPTLLLAGAGGVRGPPPS